ncbi:MAG: zinc ABC transporter substrate-binding protein [Candidatus Eisenbacteria bacterium]|nr:zinc ABC transporter substrate-binding protein [Candidatus Eisenbacteria bacterium]
MRARAARWRGRWRLATAAAVVALQLAAGAPAPAAAASSTAATPERPALSTVAGIDPIAFVVERVGGPRVEVRVAVSAGQDPHTYEPTPAQMAALSGGRLYFRTGLPFEERLLGRIAEVAPQLAVVDVGRGVPRRRADDGAHRPGAHDDGADAGHDHGEADPHIWMSPRLMKTIAGTVCDALVEADPAGADEYRRRLEALLSDLDTLHAEIAAALAPLRGRSLYVFHDAFGYFADAYGLRQVAIETGGREPGPRRVAGIIESARRDGIRVIFVQPQFSTLSAQAIAREIGGAVVPFDPLARDYIASMRKAAGAVAAALSAGG